MYLAMDPGMCGAFVTMDTKFKIHDYFLMPTYKVKMGKRNQNRIDFDIIYKHFYREPNFEKVFMEMPMAMPEQDISSVARAFGNRQRIAGILQGLGNEIIDVYPSAWKRVMKITRDKATSIQLAQRYRDECSPGFDFVMPRCRVAHDGVAEAYLIGIYGLTKKI